MSTTRRMPQSKRKLLFVPFPLKDESPVSMFKRAARKNGCKRTQLLSSHFPSFRKDEQCLKNTCANARFFAEQAGEHADLVLSGFYQAVGVRENRPHLNIHGMNVHSDIIRHKFSAYCSECNHTGAELFYRDIALMEICPVHLKKYMTFCPSCGDHLPWYSPLYEHCNCGQLLQSDTCLPNDATPELFLAKLWKQQDQSKLNKLIKILKRLDYRFRAVPTPYNRGILKVAIAIIEDQTEPLFHFARQLMDCHPTTSESLLKAKFSDLELAPDTNIDSILRYAQTLPPGRVEPDRDFSLSRAQVMEHLHLAPYQFAHLQQHEDFPSKSQMRNWFTPMEIESIAKLCEWGQNTQWGVFHADSSKMLNRREVADSLAISCFQLKQIIDNDLIHTYTDNHGSILFKLKDLQNFQQAYTVVKTLAADLGISPSLLRQRRSSAFPGAKTIGTHALDVLLIRNSHVSAVIKKTMASRNQNNALASRAHRLQDLPLIQNHDDGWVTAQSAADTIGYDKTIIYQWVRSGIFDNVATGPSAEYLIPSEQVDDFWEEYIDLTRTAAVLDLKKSLIPSILFLENISPASAPWLNQNSIYLYRKSEILNYQNLKTASGSIDAPADWMSLKEAAEVLQITKQTLRGILYSDSFRDNLQCAIGKLYVRRDFIKNFDQNYMLGKDIAKLFNIHRNILARKLLHFGIKAVTGQFTDGRTSNVYRKEDITPSLVEALNFIPTEEPAEFIRPKAGPNRKELIMDNCLASPNDSSYIHLDSLLEKYCISKKAFTQIFLKHGYIRALTINHERYLTSLSAEAASEVLEHYYTCAQADTLFKKLNHTRWLIAKKRLYNENPIPESSSKTTLVSKLKVHRILAGSKPVRKLP